MKALLKLSSFIDAMNERIGKIAAWFVVLAVVVSVANAVVRYTLPMYASNAYLELQWYLYGIVFMLGAAWTLKSNEHVRIDIVSSSLSKRTRDKVDIFGHLVFLAPFVLIHLYFGWDYFWRSYAVNEVSTNAGGLLLWPAKGVILLGFMLLGLQGLSEFIKRVAILRGDLSEEDHKSAHELAMQAEVERLKAATVVEEAAAAAALAAKTAEKVN
jgi:TRAP-type mannitol/chloroaromatic compound transport system permease small subunit